MEAKDRIHTIGKSDNEAFSAEAEDIKARTERDMGKVAIFVSILSVILLIVFYFGLNQNVTGLTEEVKQVAVIQEQVTGMQGRMGEMEARVQAMENLPAKAKKMVMSTMIMEMAQRAAYLSTQVDTEEQADKLNQAIDLLQQVQTDLIKE